MIIIDYFMSKDKSISKKKKMFWHIARDDIMFTSMRCISRHENTQVYGTILQKELTNQAMLESKAYKTYYAFAFREKTPKPKLKTKAKVAKYDKKKQPAKMPKAKGLDVLSKVALTEAEQLKLATKRSKKQFHILQSSGSGDGTDFESEDLDEQNLKILVQMKELVLYQGFLMYTNTNLKERKSLGVTVEKKIKIMKATLLIKVMGTFYKKNIDYAYLL
nr:hypothetical protein [Tanacetum cinerariifolium]